MLRSERKKLYEYDGKYLSIAISENGERYYRYPVVWNNTSNAYSMILPQIYISKQDLLDDEIMKKISEYKVSGCYIFCALDNYDFLKTFEDMCDLNIYEAYNLQDLSFLNHYKECRMLFISRAHLKNINEIVGKEPYFVTRPRCLALYDCVIDDISYIKEQKCNFNELVVCNPKSRDERERWRGLHRLYYYDMND